MLLATGQNKSILHSLQQQTVYPTAKEIVCVTHQYDAFIAEYIFKALARPYHYPVHTLIIFELL